MVKLKGVIVSVAALCVILGVIGTVKLLQNKAQAGADFTPPPALVNVYMADVQTWPATFSAVGTVRAQEGITVTAEIPGKVKAIHFRSGDIVQQGDLLVEQDSRNELAQLASAEARLKLATSNFQRISTLLTQKTVSQSQYEASRQELAAAKADVSNLQATLEKKDIRAPFSGYLGIRLVDLGQSLQASDAIVTLQDTNSLKVNFSIPQKWVSHVRAGLPVEVNMIESPDSVFHGKMAAVGAEVNDITRSVTAQAIFDNHDKTLLPGMAVSVRVALERASTDIVIPATSVIYAPFGDSVFIIEENSESGQLQARQQFIQIAERRGDFVSVIKGLKEGQNVATAGAFKLFNGQPVTISESEEVDYKLSPTPNDA